MGLFSRRNSEHQVLKAADRLSTQGRHREAIDLLTTSNRRERSSRIEERLVVLRHDAFFHQTSSSSLPHWPPPVSDRFVDHHGIPEIQREQLSADVVRDGVFNRGSIIIRGLLPDSDVECLREGIIQTYKHHDMALAGAPTSETTPWFVPFQPTPQDGDQDLNREWYRNGGAELAADSPRGLFNLIESLESNGLINLVSRYLGERPGLSVRKTSLREIPCDHDAENGWHQDGAFLGEGIRTMNLWIALSDCGVDAPSMDMVPRRLDYIVPTGTEGAMFSWSVSKTQIAEACGGGEPTHLHFKAGDAIVFDEMNLHRTSTLPGMTKSRYAIEAWFFAPSCYPLDQLPLMV